jgi:3',5'-nucleoside bisphosphate phosphatase
LRPSRHGEPSPVAGTGGPPTTVDLHSHTTRSDGVLEPEELVAQAAAVGVRIFSITDHDSIAAYRDLTAAGRVPAGMDLIPGVEINALARSLPGIDELHVLGFGMDAADEAFEEALRQQRSARRIRFERTVARLREIGLSIDAQVSALDLTRDDALGRPTIGRALIAAGHASSVEDAFQRLIGWGGPAYVPREGLGPVAAIRMIRGAGGLPALAHFWDAPNQEPLLRELQAEGLAGLEVYHSSFTRETSGAIGAVASSRGLIPTGGSDYHGDLVSYAEAHAMMYVPDEIGTLLVSRLHR